MAHSDYSSSFGRARAIIEELGREEARSVIELSLCQHWY